MKLILPLLGANAVLMMAAALVLWLTSALPPAFTAHLVLALGILPLIIAAMIYFVPVLTRSGDAPRWLQAMAPLAWLGGLLLLIAARGGLNTALTAALEIAGALLAAKAAASPLLWMLARGRASLGAPHPGLAWYVAALGFLLAALAMVPLLWLWPEQRAALRLLHLHANLLGFVVLTAIGTVQVLLPTAAAQFDKTVAGRLKRDLKFAVAGAALIAVGSAYSLVVAAVGALLLLIPVVTMGSRWAIVHGQRLGHLHGATTALALACLGLVGLLFAGLGHARGHLAGQDALLGFVFAFLLPLVSGAIMQLLPVWLRPGRQDQWHERLRHALGRYAGVHAALLVAAGLALSLGWFPGLWLAGAGLLALVARWVWALRTMSHAT